jgi:valyl-tRNA synthetase
VVHGDGTLAKPALQAYRDGRVRFVPERFGRTYEAWLENIRDWNVSRQVWWGHQLPVWYGPNDEVFVAETRRKRAREAAARFGVDRAAPRPGHARHVVLERALAVLDSGLARATPELAHWYPNQVMITGREIIFLWVARMMMLGLHFIGDVPFRTVFIAPLVFDLHGRKMSKSLGNVIDPMDLVEKYGADGFRLGIVRQMRLESQELRFDERFCEKARDFNNKMWNALRYVRGLPEGLPRGGTLPAAATSAWPTAGS